MVVADTSAIAAGPEGLLGLKYRAHCYLLGLRRSFTLRGGQS